MSIVHGALDHAELAALGLEPQTLLDFSSNVNPFGPPPGVRQTLATLDPAAYPDRSCYGLRQRLAERHGCMPAQVLLGNGSNELIHLLARALLSPGDRALVIGPTFGEYAHASRLAGAAVLEWQADSISGFRVDLAAVLDLIRQQRPRLVWLCAPNNPTGAALAVDELAALVAACGMTGGTLALDRAYAEMQRDSDPLAVEQMLADPAVVRLHSLTKLYALAGLRLGYALGSAEVIARIAVYQPAWSVNSAAQAAGCVALDDRTFVTTTLPLLWQSSDKLRDGLAALGLSVLRAALPFMLVRTGDGAATRAALLQHGMVVRDCASFGLSAYVRVAPGRPEQNQRLIAAWSTR